MKKLFLFAATAAMLAACSSEKLDGVESVKQQTAGDGAINISAYTPRATTRAGAPEVQTTATIATNGFGVLAYYTDDDKYNETAKPNFMYNTKVTSADAGATWTYNPVMYWPNEFGADATSDHTDYVSFFAYGPYVEVDPVTGIPYQADGTTPIDEKEKNITFVSKNTAGGDPIVKYIVDTDPKTSVDLLWGVAGNETSYTPIAGTNPVKTGKPYIDLIKPANPATDKLSFNLLHALSKLNVDIRYVADSLLPNANDAKPNNPAASAEINKNETRIFVRWIKIGGFIMKGALNLNSTLDTNNKPVPNWKSYLDGQSALAAAEPATFNDGRKEGKEGTQYGEQTSELPLCLNPNIVENYAADQIKYNETAKKYEFNTTKTDGVTKTAVNLFGDGESAKNAPIFVIPAGDPIDIEISYDVETIDTCVAGYLSDGVTHGTSINQTIRKSSDQIFGSETQMLAGKGYTIHILLGMTSVKFDAAVVEWDTTTEEAEVGLPDNQPEGAAEATSNTNAIRVGTVFGFEDPTWHQNGSARVAAISDLAYPTVYKMVVTGTEADGTYFVNKNDFGASIQAGATDSVLVANANGIKVYESEQDARNGNNPLFTVNVKKNAETNPVPAVGYSYSCNVFETASGTGSGWGTITCTATITGFEGNYAVVKTTNVNGGPGSDQFENASFKIAVNAVADGETRNPVWQTTQTTEEPMFYVAITKNN